MVTPDPEVEALRAVEAFESVGASKFLALFVDDRTMRTEVEDLDSTTLKRQLRSCVERSARRYESFVLSFSNPELIQVDDCDETVRARLAPFAFLTYRTSPNRYQAWLCLAESAEHRSVRQRLFLKLAPTGANGIPCGGTRWPGTLNCKPKHRRGDGSFPTLTIVSIAPGRRVSTAELERAGLLAPPATGSLKPLLRTLLPRVAGIARLTRTAAFWNRRKVLILHFRGVTEHPEYPLRVESWGHVRAAHFVTQLDYLRRHCQVISLGACVNAIRHGHPLPDYSVVLTFDEGYRNFASAAAPHLLARGFPATLFVVPERLGRDDLPAGAGWTACDDERYLSWGEVRAIRRQGFEVGVNLPHRSTFPVYTMDAAKVALSHAYEQLLAETGNDSPPLAFRSGEYQPSLVVHAKKLGLSCALHGADLGMNAPTEDPFALRRLIFDGRSHDDPRMFAADVSGLRLWWTRLARHAEVDG